LLVGFLIELVLDDGDVIYIADISFQFYLLVLENSLDLVSIILVVFHLSLLLKDVHQLQAAQFVQVLDVYALLAELDIACKILAHVFHQVGAN